MPITGATSTTRVDQPGQALAGSWNSESRQYQKPDTLRHVGTPNCVLTAVSHTNPFRKQRWVEMRWWWSEMSISTSQTGDEIQSTISKTTTSTVHHIIVIVWLTKPWHSQENFKLWIAGPWKDQTSTYDFLVNLLSHYHKAKNCKLILSAQRRLLTTTPLHLRIMGTN